MNLLKSFGQEKLPSIINDPFAKMNIEQKFEGETFDEVVLKVKAMLDNL